MTRLSQLKWVANSSNERQTWLFNYRSLPHAGRSSYLPTTGAQFLQAVNPNPARLSKLIGVPMVPTAEAGEVDE